MILVPSIDFDMSSFYVHEDPYIVMTLVRMADSSKNLNVYLWCLINEMIQL